MYQKSIYVRLLYHTFHAPGKSIDITELIRVRISSQRPDWKGWLEDP